MRGIKKINRDLLFCTSLLRKRPFIFETTIAFAKYRLPLSLEPFRDTRPTAETCVRTVSDVKEATLSSYRKNRRLAESH